MRGVIPNILILLSCNTYLSLCSRPHHKSHRRNYESYSDSESDDEDDEYKIGYHDRANFPDNYDEGIDKELSKQDAFRLFIDYGPPTKSSKIKQKSSLKRWQEIYSTTTGSDFDNDDSDESDSDDENCKLTSTKQDLYYKTQNRNQRHSSKKSGVVTKPKRKKPKTKTITKYSTTTIVSTRLTTKTKKVSKVRTVASAASLHGICLADAEFNAAQSGATTLFPFIVSFRRINAVQKNHWVHFCSGTMIDFKTVVSSGICFDDSMQNRFFLEPDNYRVVAGGFDVKINNSNQEQWRSIRTIDIVQGYLDKFIHDDVAIITIVDYFLETAFVKFLPIKSKWKGYDGDVCVIVGYGMETEGTAANILRYLCILLDSRKKCETKYGEKVGANFICSQSKDLIDCKVKYDYGGALACNDSLVGIVSHGFGCNKQIFPDTFIRSHLFYRRSLNSKLNELSVAANSYCTNASFVLLAIWIGGNL